MNTTEFKQHMEKEIEKYQKDNKKATSFVGVKPHGKSADITAKIEGFIDIDSNFASSISSELERKFKSYAKIQPCVVTIHFTFTGGEANSFAFIFAYENNDIQHIYRIEHDLSNY